MSDTFISQLNEIIETLSAAKEDAQKFDAGNDAAGKRLRAMAQAAKTQLQNLRVTVQNERNSRKS
jgi:hypothetical protein